MHGTTLSWPTLSCTVADKDKRSLQVPLSAKLNQDPDPTEMLSYILVRQKERSFDDGE